MGKEKESKKRTPEMRGRNRSGNKRNILEETAKWDYMFLKAIKVPKQNNVNKKESWWQCNKWELSNGFQVQ